MVAVHRVCHGFGISFSPSLWVSYCSISFKLTLGVMRDPKNQFNIISTMPKIWREATEIFDIGTKIGLFCALHQFWALCDAREVRQSPAWRETPAKFARLRDAWLSIRTKYCSILIFNLYLNSYIWSTNSQLVVVTNTTTFTNSTATLGLVPTNRQHLISLSIVSEVIPGGSSRTLPSLFSFLFGTFGIMDLSLQKHSKIICYWCWLWARSWRGKLLLRRKCCYAYFLNQCGTPTWKSSYPKFISHGSQTH
jgi:hypothetical protein